MSFPRLYARTRRLTLGVPRSFSVSADGTRVLFLRSRSGTDPVTCLWEFDVASAQERLLFDPGADPTDLPPEERSRRERVRESAGGVVAYATDRSGERIAFAVGSELFVDNHLVPTDGQALDPRPSPDGRHVAYVSRGSVHVIELASGEDATIVSPEGANVTYGLAEFVAAEELNRTRGYWWSPHSDAVLIARVDESPVPLWYIPDPANPDIEPVRHRYPAAGTSNALVTAAIVRLDGTRVEIALDSEYLVQVVWDEHDLLLVTLTRDQRTLRVLSVDAATGSTSVVREDTDASWVEVKLGVPAHLGDGRLVWLADEADTRMLLVDGQRVTPTDLVVRDVLAVGSSDILFRACTEPAEPTVWRWTPDGIVQLSPAGVWTGTANSTTTVLAGSDLDDERTQVRVIAGDAYAGAISNHAEVSGLTTRVALHRAGSRRLSTAVVLPAGYTGGPLPVLLDPYGGPHVQRVLASRRAFLEPQWWADQGFAVLIVDGRGTPGRGPAFERAVHHDLTCTLDDQIDALHALAGEYELDLGKVAIRGWSFGGWLAALGVLRRPDVFHVAVAGAPVTDWRLYDTAYTERYLGHPDEGRYPRNSVLDDAPRLERPLMLIHGLADDNVAAANTLRLSSALLAAGKAHTVLPLSGVTHMASSEVVEENMMLLQLDFIRRALHIAVPA